MVTDFGGIWRTLAPARSAATASGDSYMSLCMLSSAEDNRRFSVIIERE
jgi:hypothetical protein